MPFADYQLQSYWFTNSLGVNTYGWLYEPKGAQPIIANKRGIVSRTNRFQLTWNSMGYMSSTAERASSARPRWVAGWLGGWVDGRGGYSLSEHIVNWLGERRNNFMGRPWQLTLRSASPTHPPNHNSIQCVLATTPNVRSTKRIHREHQRELMFPGPGMSIWGDP